MRFIPSRCVMIYQLYLIGYGNQVPDDFFARLEEHQNGFLVIDVRARRRSWAYSYSAPQVEYLFTKRGHHYLWFGELGAAGGNGRRVELVNEQVGLWGLETQIRRSSRPVVLLCAERLSRDCHRSVVADRLAERLAKAGDVLEVWTL